MWHFTAHNPAYPWCTMAVAEGAMTNGQHGCMDLLHTLVSEGVLVGWSGCTITKAKDAKSLLEEGQHKALKPLGGVKKVGIDQCNGDLVECVHWLSVSTTCLSAGGTTIPLNTSSNLCSAHSRWRGSKYQKSGSKVGIMLVRLTRQVGVQIVLNLGKTSCCLIHDLGSLYLFASSVHARGITRHLVLSHGVMEVSPCWKAQKRCGKMWSLMPMPVSMILMVSMSHCFLSLPGLLLFTAAFAVGLDSLLHFLNHSSSPSPRAWHYRPRPCSCACGSRWRRPPA